jgi:maltose O-acetyltransferase
MIVGPLINAVGGSYLVPARLRVLLYKACGMQLPLGAIIRPKVVFRTSKISMGRASTINHGCIFDNGSKVTIGSGVGIGIGARFITSTHDMSNPERRAGVGWTTPIVVEDGVWIGSSATILGGVTIGAGCVVAAGAVVTKSCAPNGLYGGVPARRIRDIS